MSYKSQLPFSETLFTEVVDFIYECLYIENNCKNTSDDKSKNMNYSALDTDDSFIQSESIDMTRTFTSSFDNSVYSDETVESNLLSTAQSKKTFAHVYNDYEYINKPREKYFIARSNLKNVQSRNDRNKITVNDNGKLITLGMKTSNVFMHKKCNCSKTLLVEVYGPLPSSFIKCLRCFKD